MSKLLYHGTSKNWANRNKHFRKSRYGIIKHYEYMDDNADILKFLL